MSEAEPRRVDADHDELCEIVMQSLSRTLTQPEAAQLIASLQTLAWLQTHLEAKDVDLNRLRRMLFGPSSEKTNVVFPTDESEGSTDDEAEPQDGDEQPAEPSTEDADDGSDHGDDKPDGTRKGHGRVPASDYRGAERICVPHESLAPGDVCPACGKGKVYELAVPAVLVRITGAAPLRAKVHELQRLRCNLCGEIFTARAPPEAGPHKYDETAAAMIALLRYGAGLPHNRLAKLQRSVGIPLPASTQWDIIYKAAPSIAPLYHELIRQAAQGQVVHNDDTKMVVLALTGKRRAKEAPPDDPPDRTGMFTTGIVSLVDGRRLVVFCTGRQHAGENLTDVLVHRAAELDAPIHMCDGLARNLPHELSTILANCLSHARRHFVDVADNFPSECRHVLEELAKVFKSDAKCKKLGMSDEKRLAFHQEHSEEVMTDLEDWMNEQLEERRVEPNSGLGQAFEYMLKRWPELTLFLRKPGAPLSNNICERALKRAIVHRKNSLFYRSLRGALIGDAFMSLIHTAEQCGADPLDYLVALLRHADAARRDPARWMPWNYTEARAALVGRAA